MAVIVMEVRQTKQPKDRAWLSMRCCQNRAVWMWKPNFGWWLQESTWPR